MEHLTLQLTPPRCRWQDCTEPSTGESHGSIGGLQVAIPFCDEHAQQLAGTTAVSIIPG